VHDTTKFSFIGSEREGLGPTSSKGHGFLGHFSIAVSADDRREPLGALAAKTWARTERGVATSIRSGAISQAEARELPRESARWANGVAASEAVLAGTGVSAIHVMDSEGDDYSTFASLAERGERFVIRGFQGRKTQLSGGATVTVKQFVAAAPAVATRTVKLSQRKKQAYKQPSRRRTQAREGREAELTIHVERVELTRPTYVEKTKAPQLAVNVVYVREVADDVEEPVEWLLYTTEAIDTQENALRVVDFYRARWVIEEFFKSLKTGCAFETRQLESFHTLENALALAIPIAWGLLRLRVLARDYPELKASTILTKTQITILRKKKLLTTATPSAQLAMQAVAQLGGHIKNNGQPGWIVLGRGYERLLALEQGFLLAFADSDQS